MASVKAAGAVKAVAAAGAFTALTALAASTALTAQCPDGTPPPCGSRTSAPARGSVAILYMQSRDSSDAYLADGLTEDVTTLLARRTGIVVKPSSSVRLAQRRQPDAAPRALGRALAVRYVVQGSLRRAADRVRLNVQLVDAGTDVSVWGETYDRTAQGLLDLPAELANEIASRVSGAGPTRAAPAVPVWRTTNPIALDHFRRGNYLLAGRAHFDQAFAEYQEAARLDPRFAAAVARSAYVMALIRNYGGPDSVIATGLQLADAALRLDSTSSDAWMALGFLRSFANPRTLEGVTDAFERALRFDSTNAEAWHQYGQVLAWLGDDAAAIRAVERALALEPARAISLSDLSGYSRRIPARARLLLDSALAIDHTLINAWRFRAVLALHERRPADALADADSLQRYGLNTALSSGLLRLFLRLVRIEAWAMMGDSVRARAEYHDASAWPPAWASQVDLVLGDTATALDRLESISPAQLTAQMWSLLRFPEYDGLRGNPRFQRVYLAARPPGARAP